MAEREEFLGEAVARLSAREALKVFLGAVGRSSLAGLFTDHSPKAGAGRGEISFVCARLWRVPRCCLSERNCRSDIECRRRGAPVGFAERGWARRLSGTRVLLEGIVFMMPTI